MVRILTLLTRKGRDVIAQAQSGTGKTATFSISILQSIDTTVRETQVRRFWVYWSDRKRKVIHQLLQNPFSLFKGLI